MPKPPAALKPPSIPNPFPWVPTRDLSTAEGRAKYATACSCIQQLAQGSAESDAQQRILHYIIHVICGTYDLSFRPPEQGGSRGTDFAEGKRFVGLQLVTMLETLTSSLTTGEPTEQG